MTLDGADYGKLTTTSRRGSYLGRLGEDAFGGNAGALYNNKAAHTYSFFGRLSMLVFSSSLINIPLLFPVLKHPDLHLHFPLPACLSRGLWTCPCGKSADAFPRN